MSRRNQPKAQRAKKVPASLKTTQKIATQIPPTPAEYAVRRTLSYGSGYGWMGKHPADLASLLKKAIAAFGRLRKTIDIQAIAYTGSSGAAIAFPLAIAYELPIIYVRKKGEQSHGCPVECNYTQELENYIIVDDFIAFGATVRRIIKGIKDYAGNFGWEGPECVGVFVFDPQHDFRNKFPLPDDKNKPTSQVIDVFSPDTI